MGLFYTVKFQCPQCNNEFEAQTKSGSCILKTMLQSEVSPEDLEGLDRVQQSPSRKSNFIVSYPKPSPVEVNLVFVPDDYAPDNPPCDCNEDWCEECNNGD